jgi:hypothetical protein
MDRYPRAIISTLASGLIVASALTIAAPAQSQRGELPTDIPTIRHNSGQSVVPYFEGWIRNTDGTFDMVFGYFNRNYVQEFALVAGPDNKVEPGAMDQGQPTYFLPRRQRYVYRIRVPADFGDKEVVWTITANGRTERGYGKLIPPQEITERVIMTNGNFDPGRDDPNKPPSLKIAPVAAITLGTPVTLTTLVTDDGLPKPRPAAPALTKPAAAPGGFGAQVTSSAAPTPRGVMVTWLQYSGPAKVTFANTGAIPVSNGQAMTTATFIAPGTYKLIASAVDPGHLSTNVSLTVQVGK